MESMVKAYALACEAAALDFDGAMSGLLAGHQRQIEAMREKLADKDMAFLMALSLTEKGKRLDSDGVMRAAIVKGLEGCSLSATERKFIDNDR